MNSAKRQEFAAQWAAELSARCGRPVADILSEGLTAHDFTGDSVRVQFEDGSEVHFRWAFFVRKIGDPSTVGVFTEHCGHHQYELSEDDLISGNG